MSQIITYSELFFFQRDVLKTMISLGRMRSYNFQMPSVVVWIRNVPKAHIFEYLLPVV